MMKLLSEKNIVMERRMMGNYHVRCEVGENLEIMSNSYLSL